MARTLRLTVGVCMVLLGHAIFLASANPLAIADAESLRWKPVAQAQLKLDGKIPLTWNVYLLDKKKNQNLVLVLLGHRYLMLDTKAKLVYQVNLSDLRMQGQDFESGDLAQSSQRIPSTDWTARDVGPAESIQLTLEDYGRALELQLPHIPDLRGLY